MDIAYMVTIIVVVLFVITVITLPLTVLFDIIAFIVYLTQLKSDNAKRRGAENVFMIASVCLTVNIAVAALCYIILRILW